MAAVTPAVREKVVAQVPVSVQTVFGVLLEFVFVAAVQFVFGMMLMVPAAAAVREVVTVAAVIPFLVFLVEVVAAKAVLVAAVPEFAAAFVPAVEQRQTVAL